MHAGGGVQPLSFSEGGSRLIQSSLNTKIGTTSAALHFTDVRAIYQLLTVSSSGCSREKRWQEGSLPNLMSWQKHNSVLYPNCWNIPMTGLSLPHFSQHNIKAERATSWCSSASQRKVMRTAHKTKLLSQYSTYVLDGNSARTVSLYPAMLLSSGNGQACDRSLTAVHSTFWSGIITAIFSYLKIQRGLQNTPSPSGSNIPCTR